MMVTWTRVQCCWYREVIKYEIYFESCINRIYCEVKRKERNQEDSYIFVLSNWMVDGVLK